MIGSDPTSTDRSVMRPVAQEAARLGIDSRTLQRALEKASVFMPRIGRRRLVRVADVERVLAESVEVAPVVAEQRAALISRLACERVRRRKL